MQSALEQNLGKPAPSATRVRFSGALLFGMGAILAKIGVLDVLSDARTHQARTLGLSKGVAFIPVFLLLGGLMLVGGANVTGWGKRFERRPDGSRPPAAWVLGLVLAAPGLALYFWLQKALGDLGYKD
jgi:hypothetical protein